MLFLRVHRRFTTWLALLAMVLGALAPTLAQAMVAPSDRADRFEICTVSGMVWVQADADAVPSQGSQAPGADATMHCPWCTLHGGAADLPPLQLLAEPLPRQTDLPPAFYRAVSAAGIWAPPQARAPPLSA
jgi:hypothetical protein